MKKAFLSVLFTLFIIPFAFSQDLITTKNGDEIKAKVLEITPQEVKYSTTDKAGVLQSMPAEQVFMIKYENGKKDIFTEQAPAQTQAPALNQTPVATPAPNQTAPDYQADRIASENLYIKGQNDAKIYYRDYKTAGTVTLVSTILISPVGLVTAIATSATKPAKSNLDYPDAGLFAQADYARGYTAKAKKIKSGKVWSNFGIGMGTLLIFSILVNAGAQ